MKSKLCIGFLLSALIPQVNAQTDPESELLELLQEDLDKYSKIATDTKRNVDYMPYVMSVMTASDLKVLGIINLREALGLLPGVDLSVGMAGSKNPIFRGSNSYAIGQSTLVIDGVVVNDALFGGYTQYLDMPVDIIQRIEVVRGPGSLLSHVSGYSGSIHVITKANRDDSEAVEDSVFASVASDDYGMAGLITSYQKDKLSLSTDLYYQQHDKSQVSGIDRFNNTGVSDQSLENYNLAVNASYGNFSLKSRIHDNSSGVSYGQAFSLSDDTTDFLDIANNYLELAYKFDLADKVTAQFVAGYFDEHRELQNKVMPDGATAMNPMTMMPMTLVNGRYFLVDYVEQTSYQRFEVNIRSIDNHNITTGALYKVSEVDKNNTQISNNDLVSFTDLTLLNIDERKQASFYIDDLINFNQYLSMQIGLNFDHFDDLDNQTSPRIALVYRQNDKNIYKLMYSHSYRAPSWREKYLANNAFFRATSTLDVENVDATEAMYIHKFSSRSDFKLNLYYLKNHDQIHAQNATNTFLNSGDNELYGFETEYRTALSDTDNFYINYSYVDGNNVFDELANSANHMSNAYYIKDLTDQLKASVIFNYVGKKGRIDGDLRADVDSYSTFDISIHYNIKSSDTDVSFAVKNIFDEDYYLPSPANTYPDDFLQEGINAWLGITQKF